MDGTPQDPFDEAAAAEVELPSKYVSSTTVAVGEGLRFEVTRFEVVPDRFADDDRKVGEITADVLESRAARFRDGQEIVITCKPVALEQLANEGPAVGDVITLVRGEDIGKATGWRFTVERAEGAA